MTRDNAYRLWFSFLMFAVVFLFLKNVRTEGLADKMIALDVVPKVAATYPYDQQTFRVRVTIPRHKDNRLWSYTASCGEEIKSSEHELDRNSQITTTWFEEFTVTDDCIFQVCLHRIVAGKVKNFCQFQGVTAND